MGKQEILGGAFDNDRSPVAQIQIGTKASGLQPYNNIKEYSYDTDILTLNDSFIVRLSNVDGEFSSALNLGDTVKLFISDPKVQNGKSTPKLLGITTELEQSSSGNGSSIMIHGSDLGWHLANNSGPIFKRYRGKSLNNILSSTLDKSWGIQGVRGGDKLNVRAKLGRAGLPPLGQGEVTPVPSPIQFEPGQTIADVIIPLARRQGLLINMSADGWLQFFTPDYTQKPSYVLHYHKSTEIKRNLNNVKDVKFSRKIDGIYSEVTCVGQVAYPENIERRTDNPNEGRIRGVAVNTNKSGPFSLPFQRNWSFSDCDQMNTKEVVKRAIWKIQRGKFDSWSATYTVSGHSQVPPGERNSIFYEPNTMIDVQDTVNGISGAFYVRACRYSRGPQGTQTDITIHYPNQLGA